MNTVGEIEMSNLQKYNKIQVTLHWVTALLIFFMLAMGHFVLAATPNSDPIKIIGLKGHMIIGGLVLILTVARLIWRFMSAQPPHAKTGSLLLDKLGTLAHYTLYLLTLLTAFSGIGIAIQADLPNVIWMGQGVLPDTFEIFLPRIAHGILTKLLVALIILHFFAGLYHHFILKDGLFRRMSYKEDK
jgi:cytochrome b561